MNLTVHEWMLLCVVLSEVLKQGPEKDNLYLLFGTKTASAQNRRARMTRRTRNCRPCPWHQKIKTGLILRPQPHTI
uniref:Uncharacterized protein n=1 Tax=Mycena chlorophos TaxID=658473 RepID=A0ABQ0LES3_MYCCL|nr:predicted protein [Mycena chlorophos]